MIKKIAGETKRKNYSLLRGYLIAILIVSIFGYLISLGTRFLWAFLIPPFFTGVLSIIYFTKTREYIESLLPAVFLFVVSLILIPGIRVFFDALNLLDQSLFIWHGLILFYAPLANGGTFIIVAIVNGVISKVK